MPRKKTLPHEQIIEDLIAKGMLEGEGKTTITLKGFRYIDEILGRNQMGERDAAE